MRQTINVRLKQAERHSTHEIPSLLLHKAVLNNDAAKVRSLLREGASALYRIQDMTPLDVAANQGYAVCAADLLPLSDPNAISAIAGHNAMTFAIVHGNPLCVELLAPFCDSRVKCLSQTALEMAFSRNDPAMIESLLPFAELEPKEMAPLIELAYEHSTTEAVDILLREAGPAIVAAHLNRHGQTPLLMMANMLNETILKALLPMSDPAERDPSGRTALMIAAQGDSSDDPQARCVAALLPVSDLAAVDHDGATALTCALGAGNSVAAGLIGAFAALRERSIIDAHARQPAKAVRKPRAL